MFVCLTVNFLSALMFANRILKCEAMSHHSKIGAKGELPKIGTALFLIALISAILARRAVLLSLILVPTALILWVMRTQMMSLWRWRGYERDQIEILDLIILGMRSGQSYRVSLRQVLRRPPWLAGFGELLGRRLEHHWQGSTDHFAGWPARLQSFAGDLISVDQSPHDALKRLQAWRRQLRTEFEFRRRSGQILTQIRTQAVVVGALYFALLAGVNWQVGFWRYRTLFLVSLALFSAGVFAIFTLGKKVKWSF